jgi:hypothetical protein
MLNEEEVKIISGGYMGQIIPGRVDIIDILQNIFI